MIRRRDAWARQAVAVGWLWGPVSRDWGGKCALTGVNGSSDRFRGRWFVRLQRVPGSRPCSVGCRWGMGRISSRIGGKILPSPARAPAGQAGRSPGARFRPSTSTSATTGTRPARGSRPWADVAHSPTRSVSHRVLAAERGIAASRCLVSGTGPVSGPTSPNPPPCLWRDRGPGDEVGSRRGGVWRTPRPSQSPRRRDRPWEAFVLASVVMAWRSGRRREQTPTEPTEAPDLPLRCRFSPGVAGENPRRQGITPRQPVLASHSSGEGAVQGQPLRWWVRPVHAGRQPTN